MPGFFVVVSCMKMYIFIILDPSASHWEGKDEYWSKTQQERQCRHNVTLRHVRANIVAVENNEYYTTWVCVSVALVIQQARGNRRIVICGLPRSTIFFTLSHKRHDFRGGGSYRTQNVCFDFLYNFCRKHFSF